MKYCSNCGQPLREGVKVCTNCGAPVKATKDQKSNHDNQKNKTQHVHSNHTQKSNKKMWMIIGIIALLFIALIIAFSILKSQFSPEKQASNIAHAIKKDDEKALSKEVTSGDENLNKEEARAYLDYIKEEDDLNNVANHVEQTAKDVKDKHYKNLSVDANGNNVLNISKDGKKFVFFDNYNFNIPQRSISMYPNESGTITYDLNGNKKHISVDEGDSKSLGTFPIGNYNLKATKEIDDQKFNGALVIDMSQNGATATESFKQIRFNVYTEGDYMLDNVKVYANNKEIGEASSSETYGPYDPNEKVIVYAEGTYEGKTFKSDSVNVTSSSDDDEDVTDVTVRFDDDAIDNYVDQKLESDSADDNSDDSEEVTRANVIDKVESYEGHTLDTDTYTYKEPEITDDGKWGFSFTDKDGDLAGSYTVDRDDGYVTEYDEHGDEVGSGY